MKWKELETQRGIAPPLRFAFATAFCRGGKAETVTEVSVQKSGFALDLARGVVIKLKRPEPFTAKFAKGIAKGAK